MDVIHNLATGPSVKMLLHVVHTKHSLDDKEGNATLKKNQIQYSKTSGSLPFSSVVKSLIIYCTCP